MLKSMLSMPRRIAGKALRLAGLRKPRSMCRVLDARQRPPAVELKIGWLKKLYPGATLEEIQAKLEENAVAERDGRLLCLQYPPSYKLQPRWGNGLPGHEGLRELFARHDAQYEAVFRGMAGMLPKYQGIRKRFLSDGSGEPGWVGGPINPLDTALLYYYVATRKPKTYLEIGSGMTTLFAARAKADHRLPTRIVSIDPNPRTEVDARCDEVIRAPLELCDLSVFDNLEAGDIVFMDGSHISLMNSDVTVFMLDVVPRLKPGVIIHFHDIHWPHDYPHSFTKWYWNEQYILGAYLLGAVDRVEILLPSRYASELPMARERLQPLIDAGLAEPEGYWLSGGSIWFTHRR